MSSTVVQFTYLLNRFEPTGDPSGWAHDARAQLRAVIHNYCYTFRSDDPCQLRIASCVEEDWAEVDRMVEGGSALNTYFDPPQIELVRQPLADTEIATFHDGCLPLNDRPHSFLDLYRLYKQHVSSDQVPDYETDRATNVYDMNFIMSARRHYPDYQGSVFPQNFVPLLQYLKTHGRDITSILDVGCGAGALYGVLREFCQRENLQSPHYEGLDYSRNQIMRALESYPRGSFWLGDAARLPYPDRRFDVATTNSVLSFIPGERQLLALREIIRVCKRPVQIGLVCRGNEYYKSGPSFLQNRFFGDTITTTFYPDIERVEEIVDEREDLILSKKHTLMCYSASNMRKITVSQDDYARLIQVLSQNRHDFQSKGIPEERWPDATFAGTDDGLWHIFECFEVKINPADWSPDDRNGDGSLSVYSLFE